MFGYSPITAWQYGVAVCDCLTPFRLWWAASKVVVICLAWWCHATLRAGSALRCPELDHQGRKSRGSVLELKLGKWPMDAVTPFLPRAGRGSFILGPAREAQSICYRLQQRIAPVLIKLDI